MEGWVRDGLADEQVAHNMGISYSTFKEWVNKFPALSATIKKGKRPVDLEVENMLYKNAMGYDYEETITEIEDLGNGKQKKHVRKIKKHRPPDTTAQIFWLKNRRPDRWRDKPITAEDVSTMEKLDAMLAEVKSHASHA